MSRSRGRRKPAHYQPQPYRPNQQQMQSPLIRGDIIDLGDLGGQEHEKVIASFGYYGTTIRVNPNLSEVSVMDFLENAENIGADDPRTMVVVKKWIRANIHPDDFDTFWKIVNDHGVGTDDLMRLMWKILEGVTARPTGRPSDSSAGPTETNSASRDTSSAPATDDDPRRARFLAQVQRFEAEGTADGAAKAAQVVQIAKAQGYDLEDDLIRESMELGSLSA
jgi:hypothetical protein